MEANRSYGIEIECLSKKCRMTITAKIQRAFNRANSTHTAVNGEAWNEDTENVTVWSVKTDNSIRTESDYPYNVEITSPILYGDDGLVALKIVCSVLKTCCKVNTSCGLHIHHGLLRTDDPINILIGWLRIENTLYKCLPMSRKGHFSRMLSSRINKDITRAAIEELGLLEWWEHRLGGRYFGLNLESIWIYDTVEVRAAAGTINYEKIANWAEVSQQILARASRNPFIFQEGIDNVIATITGTVRETVYHKKTQTSNLSRYGHRLNTINAFLDNIFWEGSSLSDIIFAFTEFRKDCGKTITYKQAEATIRKHANWLQKVKGVQMHLFCGTNPYLKTVDEFLPEQEPVTVYKKIRRVRTSNLPRVSRYGHRLNTINAFLDNIFWEGNFLSDMIASFMKFCEDHGKTITYKQARARVKKHANWLQKVKGIQMHTAYKKEDPYLKTMDGLLPGQEPASKTVIHAAKWLYKQYAKFNQVKG